MARIIINTFEIIIRVKLGNYTIEVAGPPNVRVNPQPFTWEASEEKQKIINQLLDDKEPRRITLDQLSELGQSMYRAVFIPQVERAFGSVVYSLRGKEDNGVRIRLVIEPPEIARLPWEIMHDGEGFIALKSNFPLVRGFSEEKQPQKTSILGAIRILYAWSTPQDLPDLPQLQNSAESIKNNLAENKGIKFDILSNANKDSLQRALDNNYHILCFAGHGDETKIYLEEKNGHYPLSAQELKLILEGKNTTKLVYLAACKTGGLSGRDMAGFAQSLARQGSIPAVVTMQYVIKNDEANRLTSRFFESLSSFRPVDAALAEARKSIVENTKVGRDIFSPVLYLQTKTSDIFRKARNWAAIAIVSSLLAVLAILAFTIQTLFFQPDRADISKAQQTALMEATGRAFAEATAQGEATKRAYAIETAQAESIIRATAETQKTEQEAVSFSRQLALIGQDLRSEKLDLSLLLSIEAYRISPTYESISSILNGLFAGRDITTILRKHSNSVSSLAISKDGSLLASGDIAGSIVFWNLFDESPQGSLFQTPLKRIYTLAFSPNNNILATSGCIDNACGQWGVYFFNVSQKEFSENKLIFNNRISLIKYLEDDSLFIVLSKTIAQSGFIGDSKLIITEIPTGRILHEIHYDNFVQDLVFNKENNVLAMSICTAFGEFGCYGSEIQLWEIPISGAIKFIETISDIGSASSVAFSPDNSLLAIGGCGVGLPGLACEGGSIQFWDFATNSVVSKIQGHNSEINQLIFTHNGDRLVSSGGRDGKLLIWDISNVFSPVLSEEFIGHNNTITSLTISSNLLISADFDGKLILRKQNKTELLRETLNISKFFGYDPIIPPINNISVSPDGLLLTIASQGLLVWDIKAHQVGYDPINVGSKNIFSTAINPDGKIIGVGDGIGDLFFIDTSNFTLLDSLPKNHTEAVWSLAFSPDGQRIASGSFDHTIVIWDVKSRELIARLLGHTDNVNSVAWSPDGNVIASGSKDGTVRLWDAKSGDQIGDPLVGHTGMVAVVAFSPDGESLASGSYDDSIIVWDINSHQAKFHLDEHRSFVTSLVYSPDGNMLASGSSLGFDPFGDGKSDQGDIILWDTRNYQMIGRILTNQVSYIDNLVFTDNGRTLISGSERSEISFWNTDIENWIEEGCSIANRNLSEQEWRQYFGYVPYRKTCSYANQIIISPQ